MAKQKILIASSRDDQEPQEVEVDDPAHTVLVNGASYHRIRYQPSAKKGEEGRWVYIPLRS